MRLIGMLDSPYVRRVAISLRLLDIGFSHEPLSVFRDFAAFAAINPLVKAPTLVTGDGVVLMESSVILQHLERIAAPGRSLAPRALADDARAQRIVGLALSACEKAVQIVYERNLRPAEKQHQPWLDRVAGQLQAACAELEAAVAPARAWLIEDRPLQADVSCAVAWRFIQEMTPELVPAEPYPGLAALSARAEALDAFQAAPFN
jgi:glutathione S-transferase